MRQHPFEPDDIVADVLNAGGQVVREFLLLRMYCPGCPMAGLMTLEEAACEHDVDLDMLLQRLNNARHNDARKAEL